MMASIAGGTRVGRVCSVAFGLIARRVGRVTRIAMVGCASPHDHQASGAGQLHPRALSEPDVILSHHPAPIVRPRP
jgi:hypothetical protein